MIPKRFIRVWIGADEIPELFEKWWNEFKQIHGGWEFITITSHHDLVIPEALKELVQDIYENGNCASMSDVLRVLALEQMGGIYIDTDIMPLKCFRPLIDTDKVFLGKRSGKSFENAVIGSPKNHEAIQKLIERFPYWYKLKEGHSASVRTGPAFVSNYLFGRADVEHYPARYFYPYNGFMAPKKPEKEHLFSSKLNFPSMMYCAHYSNNVWGTKPKNKY